MPSKTTANTSLSQRFSSLVWSYGENASFLPRILAGLIDSAILTLPHTLGIYVLMRSLLGVEGDVLQVFTTNFISSFILIFLMMSLVSILYTVWFLSKRGATPGMQLMKLRLEHPDGSLLPWKYVVFRQYIGQSVSGALFGIGYFAMTADEQQRAWHDRFVDSVVRFDDERLQVGVIGVAVLWILNIFFLYLAAQTAFGLLPA